MHALLTERNNNNFHVISAKLTIKHNISHVVINELLSILQKFIQNNLPIDARTLLKTCEGGNY